VKKSLAGGIAAAAAFLLLNAAPALAHRLDEYLEATTILVSRQGVRLDLRLAPGVAVAQTVLDSIDLDHDGTISAREEDAYVQRVINDLSLRVDGEYVALHAVARRFPAVSALHEGTGEIQIALEGDLPQGGEHRALVFDNRHRSPIAAYLVNGVVPDDPRIHIASQQRNYTQSDYEMTFDDQPAGTRAVPIGTLLRWLILFAAVVSSAVPAWRAARLRTLGRRNPTRVPVVE
jgi:hypothetical protein